MAEEKKTETKKETETKPVTETKPEAKEEKKTEEKTSVSAVEKQTEKTTKKKDKTKTELTREYTIPLRKEILKAPQYRRAKKAIKAIKEFLVRHMQIRDRDLRKVKIDMYLNNEVWFRGIKKPAHKIRVKATKKEGIVYAELAEIPEVVKYAQAREEKRKQTAEKGKTTKKEATKEKIDEDKNKDGVADKTAEKEDAKSKAELDAKTAKTNVKAEKHTTKGAHANKTMPVQKKLK